MNERKFNWFVDHMPRAKMECPYYIEQFFWMLADVMRRRL